MKLFIFGLFSINIFAANLCVKQTSAGSADGSDWNNPLGSTFTPTRGNVYYLASGIYPGKTWTTSGTTLVTIQKATVSDHGSSTGWNDSFATGIVEWTSSWIFDGAGYLTLNGVNGDSRVNYGFVMSNIRSNASYGVYLVNGAGNVTIQHTELYAYPAGTLYSNMTVNTRLVSVWNGSASTSGPLTMDYCWLHDVFGVPFLTLAGTGITINHCIVERNKSTVDLHAEGWSDTESDNVVISYCEWYELEGTAYIAGINGPVNSGMTNWNIYGNLFWSDNSWTAATPTLIYVYHGGSNQNAATNWNIFNNTIASKLGGLGIVFDQHDNIKFENNYIYFPRTDTNYATATDGFAAFGAYGIDLQDYNFFSGTTHAFSWTNGVHEVSATLVLNGYVSAVELQPPFTSWTNGNYNLISLAGGIGKGANLGSPYNIDKNGISRSIPWDDGAYEYNPTGPPQLLPNTTLRINTRLIQ